MLFTQSRLRFGWLGVLTKEARRKKLKERLCVFLSDVSTVFSARFCTFDFCVCMCWSQYSFEWVAKTKQLHQDLVKHTHIYRFFRVYTQAHICFIQKKTFRFFVKTFRSPNRTFRFDRCLRVFKSAFSRLLAYTLTCDQPLYLADFKVYVYVYVFGLGTRTYIVCTLVLPSAGRLLLAFWLVALSQTQAAIRLTLEYDTLEFPLSQVHRSDVNRNWANLETEINYLIQAFIAFPLLFFRNVHLLQRTKNKFTDSARWWGVRRTCSTRIQKLSDFSSYCCCFCFNRNIVKNDLRSLHTNSVV